MPFFSVIIPTYNRAHILEETIASIQSQMFSDWECIVVDDGSTDNTKALIIAISEKDSRVKYIHQHNAERSAARNNGINNSKGRYICFLDSDDAYKKNHLETLKNAIDEKSEPLALFFTNYTELNHGVANDVHIQDLTKNTILYLFTNAIIPARVCVHRDILLKEQFDEDITIVEDTILWVRIAQNSPVFQIPERTVKYALHDDNSINIRNNSSQKRLDGLLLFFNRYREITENIPNALKKQLLGDTYFGLARHHIYKNERVKALKAIFKSISFLGNHPQLKHKVYLIVMLLLNKRIAEYQG